MIPHPNCSHDFLPQEFRIRTESVWADLLNEEAMNLEGIRWPSARKAKKAGVQKQRSKLHLEKSNREESILSRFLRT